MFWTSDAERLQSCLMNRAWSSQKHGTHTFVTFASLQRASLVFRATFIQGLNGIVDSNNLGRLDYTTECILRFDIEFILISASMIKAERDDWQAVMVYWRTRSNSVLNGEGREKILDQLWNDMIDQRRRVKCTKTIVWEKKWRMSWRRKRWLGISTTIRPIMIQHKDRFFDFFLEGFVSVSVTSVVICMLLQRDAWIDMNLHKQISTVESKIMIRSKWNYQWCCVRWIDCADVAAEEGFIDRMRGTESPSISALSVSSVIWQDSEYDYLFRETGRASDYSRNCSVTERRRWIESHQICKF